MSEQQSDDRLALGQIVYDADGTELGTVRGFDQNGFYVSATTEAAVMPSVDSAGSKSADALMWRCWECGEMGRLSEMPESCPACGAPKEEIYYWQED
jgi:hypothetical protein